MMRVMMMLAALFVVAETTAQAGPLRRSRQKQFVSAAPRQTPMMVQTEPSSVIQSGASVIQTGATTSVTNGAEDALHEVNAERARRGLRPYQPDPMLNMAAQSCARIRAANFIRGHLPNDFAHLPAGTSASAAGCGALEPFWGWGTCCTYDNYTYAGAAWVMGTDGRRYMHLFVR
jgi:hypothetical protein